MATGTLERGVVRISHVLEAVGLRPTTCHPVAGIEHLNPTGPAPRNALTEVDLFLRRLERGDLEVGQVLCHPGSITALHAFRTTVGLTLVDDHDRFPPGPERVEALFRIRTAEVCGRVSRDGRGEAAGGVWGRGFGVTVSLSRPVALEARLRFSLLAGHDAIGGGVVAVILA